MKKRKVLVRPWEVITCRHGHKMFICGRKITEDDRELIDGSDTPYLIRLQNIPQAWYAYCEKCYEKEGFDTEEYAAFYDLQEMAIYVNGKIRAADYIWAYTEEYS